MILIYAWVNTILNKIDSATKMRDRIDLLRKLTWKRNDLNEWVKKKRLQKQALVLYLQYSHFNTHQAKGKILYSTHIK